MQIPPAALSNMLLSPPADAETCWSERQGRICFDLPAAQIRTDRSVVVRRRVHDPRYVHALHPVQRDLLRNDSSLGLG